MSMARIETSPVSAISGSSIQLADEYLDFAMPSYGDTVTNSAKAKSSDSAPAFSNPFADFGSTSSDTAAEDKAASKAAKEQDAADKKAAKEQDAADKKAADEAAAAQKKAEKEARREAEKEKQRLAVQRANEIKEEKAAAEAAPAVSYELSEIKAPEFNAPDIKIPEFKAPDIKVPEFKAPDFGGFKAPETSVDVPEFKAPEFKAPDIKMPEVSLPKFSMPKMPDMPKIDTPSVSTPSISAPSTSFEAPKIPSFSAPSVPSFSTPSFSSSSGSSGGYSSLDADIVDDQDERDAAAKEARSVFNEADANAKVSIHTTSTSNFCLNYVKTFLIVLVTIAFHYHTTNPHCFSYALTITRCHHRKSRIRQGNCGLLPMIRRRLRKKRRIQPARQDSAVKSFAFDHSELDTKITFFMLFALRNCNICYSSAKRMQNRTSSFWMFIPTNVWERDFLTLHTGGSIMVFEAYYLIILLKITLCITVRSKVRSLPLSIIA